LASQLATIGSFSSVGQAPPPLDAATPGKPPWVDPATFFDRLPIVMQQVPPMPGEEALYKGIGSMLDSAAKDPEVMKTLRKTPFAADAELVPPMMRWRVNGEPAGNGWTSPANKLVKARLIKCHRMMIP
jgi:hypothetical protein